MTESVSQNIYSGAKTLTRYKYDHEGNRVVKSSNYGEVVTPSAEISYRNDSIVTKHIFVSGVRVASKVCDEKSSNTYYQSVDHLGSTNILTDAKGEFYEHIETFPDGSIWVKEYVDQSGVNAVFTCHEMDVETKFFYAKARYYDAQLGRFISVDPILDSYLDGETNGGVYTPSNLNLFVYSYNNPITFVDPDGKAPRNMTTKQRSVYKRTVQNATPENLPNHHCAGTAAYLYQKASKAATGIKPKVYVYNYDSTHKKFGYGHLNAKTYYGRNNKNIKFYQGTSKHGELSSQSYSSKNADKSFDSGNVEVGTVGVYKNPAYPENGATGHTITVVDVKRVKGKVKSITIIEGHQSKKDQNFHTFESQQELDHFVRDGATGENFKFVGWGEFQPKKK